MDKLIEIMKKESNDIKNKNKIRLIFVYNYIIKNKLVTPTEDGAIYIAENQVEDTFLRLKVENESKEYFGGKITQYIFITRFNHKKVLQKNLNVEDKYKEMRKSKTGYLSYKEYMNLNAIFANMEYWIDGDKNDNSTR